MRWIVGDIHGCARELDDLLSLVRFDEGRDELWSVGDLINRGPHSLEALRLWRDVGARAVIGNHDVHAILVHARRRLPRVEDTLQALFNDPEAEAWMARLRALPVLVYLPGSSEGRAEDGAWLVHAGLDPRWHDLHDLAKRLRTAEHDDDWMKSEEVECATRIRCCNAAGERTKHNGRPQDCPAPFRPWDDFYHGPELVIHGHWAARGHYRGKYTLGLDSGCYYGGSLTAWCQQEDRIESVPSRASGRGRLRLDLGS